MCTLYYHSPARGAAPSGEARGSGNHVRPWGGSVLLASNAPQLPEHPYKQLITRQVRLLRKLSINVVIHPSKIILHIKNHPI